MSEVVLSREAVLEAISHLHAAQAVFTALNGNVDSIFGVEFDEAGTRLRKQAFGEDQEEDDAYEQDPAIVETWARAEEIMAEILGGAGIDQRVAEARERARLTRERGTIDVPYADVQEAVDRLEEAAERMENALTKAGA